MSATATEPLARTSTRTGLGLTDLMLLGVIIVWGTNFVILKRALQDLSPLSVNAIRFSIASLLLVIILRRRPAKPLLRSDIWRAITGGVATGGIGQVCMVYGLSLSPASQVALLTATMPIFVAILSDVVGMEHLSRRGWLGIAICFSGIIMVVGAPSSANRLHVVLGGLLILGSAFGWAVAMVITAPVLRRASASQVTAIMNYSGTLVLILLAIPTLAQEHWSRATPITWGSLVFSGALSLVIASIVWNRGVRVIGPSRTAIYSNLTPVVAALVGWLLLGEQFTGLQFVGAAVILSGLYLVRTSRVR